MHPQHNNSNPEQLARTMNSYMKMAYAMALKAGREEEVPVGAVIVCDNQVIAKAHNQVEQLNDPTAHAEIIAITQAASVLKSKVLKDAEIYVTLEPCAMCAMAIVLAKIKRLIYAAPDPKTGAAGSIMNIPRNPQFNHQLEVVTGIMEQECSAVLKDFFRERR